MRDSRSAILRKTLLVIGLVVGFAPADVFAQAGRIDDLLGLKGKSGSNKAPAEFSAALVAQGEAGEAALRISVKLPPEHYIYSTTKAEGAETKITISRAEGLEPIDEGFTADHSPKVFEDADLERTVEKYYDKVNWSKRYRIKPGVVPESVSIAGAVKYQICDTTTCRPNQKFAFEVKLAVSGEGVPAAPPWSAPTATNALEQSPQFDHLFGKRVVGTWTASVAPAQARPGDEVTISVRADLQPGWHVYPLDLPRGVDGGSLPVVIGLTEMGSLIPLGSSFTAPVPIERSEKGKVERYHEGQIEWTRKFSIPEDAAEGAIPFAGKVAWQLCDKGQCLLPTGFEFAATLVVAGQTGTDTLPFAITAKLNSAAAHEAIDEFRVGGSGAISGANPSPLPDSPRTPNSGSKLPPTTMEEKTSPSGFNTQRGIDKAQGLPLFLAAAVLAGFAALLTPCVFPMIPITVSFFQKQAEREHHRPVTMALVYCLGIVGTFTGLGMLMSIIFTAGAITQLANNGLLNLCIAGILIFFALNLLGLFEIRMPGWLLTYTAGKESRGGFIGVLFMALTFTLTSFTCTFAFAGGLLVAAQDGDRLWPILGLLAFSAAFSLPFFFLALFPSFLQKLPKSGGWMNVAKVIMGLIELGAAFKFFGTADQTWNGQAAIFDFHLMVSAWAVISVAAALYLLGLFRLPHDMPTEHVGVLRFVSAMSFMGLASYLAVGLFSAEKPNGLVWKYVKAYATPTFKGGTDPTGWYLQHGDLKYALDLKKALEFAIAENKPLFLDFTGVNCANCRYMEDGPMSQPQIEQRLARFVRVQLYTDAAVPTIPDRDEAERLRESNARLQEDWFGDVSLPSYVVIPPDPSVLKDPSKILSRLEGKKDEATFAQFLDRGWTGWQKFEATRGGRVVGRR